jgi:4-amino-4-deoxy-L-arabinose transferase-like glycosyltransferase
MMKRSSWPALALLLALVLASLPILLYPPGRDQAAYANIGQAILRGGLPYVDMWDIKPPPIYYLYALAIGLFGANGAALRLLDLLLMPPALLALYSLGLGLGGRALGLWAAALMGVFLFSEPFTNLSQSDSLALLPSVLLAWASLRALAHPTDSREARLWAALAGGLGGLLIWFKPQYAALALAWALLALVQRRRLVWGEALAFAGGGLLLAGGLLALAWGAGLLDDMLIVASGTASYNAAGAASLLEGFLHYGAWRWGQWGVLLILAGLWWPARLLALRSGAAPQPLWGAMGLWLLGGLAFLFVQGLFFDTHWLPLLPPLALLAAGALLDIARLLPRALARLGGLSLAALLSAILLGNTWWPALGYLTGQQDQAAYWRRFQGNDYKPWESLALLDYLRPRVAPGDTLYVYGFRPEIAFLGGYRPATRFQANFALIAPWYPPEWRQENVDTLWAAMPPYAIILESDYMPWVTGYDADSHTLLQRDVELNNWLMANYQRITKIGDFIVCQRRTTS